MNAYRVLGRLLSFLRPLAGWTVVSVLLGAGTVASGIGLLGTSAYLIAQAALQPSIADLQMAIVGVRAFGILRGVLRYLERLVSHSVNFRLLAGLRVWLYRTIEPLAPAGLQDRQAGDLLSRAVGDIDTLENFYVRAATPPMTALVITIGLGLYVGRWDARMGLAMVMGLALSGLGVPLLAHRLGRKPGRMLVEARAEQSAVLVEGVQGLADLLAYGQEGSWRERVMAAGERSGRAQMRTAWLGGLGTGLNILVTQLTLVAVLALAVPLVAGNRMDGPLLAVAALVTLAAFEATTPLAQAGQQMESSLAAARRLFEVEERPGKTSETAAEGLLVSPNGTSLSIRGLTFRYHPDLAPALEDFWLELPAGRRTALVGESGAGKSTLLGLLSRFWEAPAGTIWMGGEDILRCDADQVRKMMGTADQRPYLFTATVRQNLALARPGVRDEEINAALALVGLEDWLAGLPEGLDTWLGERGAAMSGGERQRLAVARAMLREAPLVLLDEPGAHLDAVSHARLLKSLEAATRRRSLILVTHNLSGLDWLDEIVVLKAGRVVERGTQAELLAAGGEFAQMQRLQSRGLAEDGELSTDEGVLWV